MKGNHFKNYLKNIVSTVLLLSLLSGCSWSDRYENTEEGTSFRTEEDSADEVIVSDNTLEENLEAVSDNWMESASENVVGLGKFAQKSRFGTSEIVPEEDLYLENNQSEGTGSAANLEGTVLIVTIYVSDDESDWEFYEKQKVWEKLEVATDYISENANAYQVPLEFIYDDGTHYDLSYQYNFNGVITDGMNLSEDDADTYWESVIQTVESEVDSDALLSEYGAQNIAYMGVIDKPGGSYAYTYESGDNGAYWNESCFLYTADEVYQEEEPPAVYAHELLHLFGAKDLYRYDDETYNEFSENQYKYIKKYYANEIMYTTYDENYYSVQERVTNDLSEITAYYVGWTNQAPEEFLAVE